MDSIVGGSSADSIYGTMSTTPTLDPFDIIDGGAGTDTFNLTLNGASYDANSTISNIEVINIRASTDHDFNANGLTGVTSMTLEGSVGASKFTNVGSAATAVGMKNISDSTADLQVWFADAALTATNDTVTVNLNSAGNTAANAPDILIRTTASANGAENLSVATSTTASNLGKLESTTNTGTGAANSVLKTLTISGAADLTVATAIEFAGSTGTVDASTFTGALDIGLDTGGIVKVTGGTGGDTFAFTTGLTVDDTIDGGAGTDTLSVTDMDTFTVANYTKLTNVEILDQTATNNADLSMVTGGATLTKVVLNENATTNKAISAADLAAGVAVDLVQTTDAQLVGATTLGLKDASGTADALTVTLKGVAAHGAADNAVASLTVSNLETLNLVSSSTSTTGGVLAVADANTLTTITADTALATINASGDSALIATVGAAATKLTKFDASTMTADASITLAAGDVSVSGGSGDDTFVFAATLNNKDTVVGGANSTATAEDTLTATVTSLTATTGALNISGVERINLTNAGTAVLSAAAVTGASEIAIAENAGAVSTTISGLAAAATVGLGFKSTANAATVLGTVVLSLADETGTADSITVKLNDITDADTNTVTLKTTAIETVNLSYSTTAAALASTTVTSTNLKAATINVTGSNTDTDNTVAMGTLSTSTTKLDGSSFEGVLTATAGSGIATAFLTDGTQADNLTGSTAADSFTIGSGAAVSHTIDGAAGSDTLNMILFNGTSSVVDMSNIETANFTVSNSAAAVLDLDGTDLFSDADLDVVNITGGNTLSTFAFNTNDTIGVTTISKIDASGFSGSTTLAFGSNAFDATTTVTGGAATTDVITAVYADAIATVAPVVSGFETVKVTVNSDADDAAEAYSINTAGFTGVTRIELNTGATATVGNNVATTLTNLAATTSVRIGNATADYENTSTITATLASATGTADALSIDMYDTEATTVTLVSAGVETLNLSANTSGDGIHTVNLTGVAATSGSTQTINLTGGVATADFTISAVATTARVINAVDYIGDVVLSDRGASAMTITGGLGGDTLRMENTADVIDGGADTGDSLVIVQNAVLGGFQIDLSSTVDQVTTYNGSANAAVQKGFLNVDVSGITGTFGADITANSAGSTITGTANNDVITGGAGVDAIDAGAGDDTIDISQSATTIDTLQFDVTTDGNDTITGFTSGVDILDFDGILNGVTKTYEEIASDTADITSDATVVVIGGTSAIATAATLIAADTTVTGTAGLIVLYDGTNTLVYHSTNLAADGTETLLATLVGITDTTTLVTADFIFA